MTAELRPVAVNPVTGEITYDASGLAALIGGGAVSSVVGQTGAVTGAQIVADAAVAAALNAKADAAATAAALTGKAPASRSVTAGTGLTGGGDLSADRSLAVAYGTGAGTACQGNDGRLSDARTPTAHTHSAADVASGILPVARGGTGGGTALDALLALGAAPRANPLELADLYSYGHSFPAGYGLATPATYGMHARLAARLRSVTSSNRGVVSSSMGGVVTAMTTGAGQWTPGTKGIVVLDAVLNHVINVTSSQDAQQRAAFPTDLRTVLRILRSSAWKLNTDGSCAYGGTWASTNQTGVANTRGTIARSSAANGTVTITTTRQNICVTVLGFGGSTNQPTFTITVNGVQQGSYTPANQVTSITGNAWNVWAIPVYAMPAGTNTVVVQRDATANDFYFQGYLEMANATPPGVVLVKDVDLTTAGFQVNGADSNRNAAGLAVYNGYLDTIAAESEFAGGVTVAAGHRAVFDTSTMVQADNVHPNSIGHQVYADGIQSAALAAWPVARNGIVPVA